MRRLTPLEIFLLDCAKAGTTEALRSNVTAAEHSSFDWSPFKKWRYHKSLIPLFIEIKGVCPSFELSPELEHQLWAAVLSNKARNQKYLAALLEIAGALEARGIRPIVMKGGQGLLTVYKQNPEVRVMVDMDLLIEESEKGQVFEVLAGLGFDTPSDSRTFLERFWQNGTTRQDARVFYKNGVALEVHWDIQNRPHQRFLETLKKHTAVALTEKMTVKIFNPAASLYMCCHNFVKDWPELVNPFSYGHESVQRLAYEKMLFLTHEFKILASEVEKEKQWVAFFELASQSSMPYEIRTLAGLLVKMLDLKVPGEIVGRLQKGWGEDRFAAFCGTMEPGSLLEVLRMRAWLYLLLHPEMIAVWGMASLRYRLKYIKMRLFPNGQECLRLPNV